MYGAPQETWGGIMSVEKMRRYIELTGARYSDIAPYQMGCDDLAALYEMAADDFMAAIRLAFEYGRAKGERHARKDMRT